MKAPTRRIVVKLKLVVMSVLICRAGGARADSMCGRLVLEATRGLTVIFVVVWFEYTGSVGSIWRGVAGMWQ